MPGVRNLTRAEATERGRMLVVQSYDITIDVTDGSGNAGEGAFGTVTEIEFDCAEPGASTFIEVAARTVRSAVLNGEPVDLSGWSAETGLPLTNLSGHNRLVVDAEFDFSRSGRGLHRALDPADNEVYLYTQFEPQSAQRVYACFDQPDLKSLFTWHVIAPPGWKVISNAPVDRVERLDRAQVVHFAASVPMSTYVTALCAGPYHEVRQTHDGIDLRLFIRRSMQRYLDADEIFLVTRQGLDFYNKQFGVRYPLSKYDQLFAPEYNTGAMENFGCVVLSEQRFIFRSQATDYEYEQRARTMLHEMAHMWFGNLVTMRWWDDLWLKESLVEWASHWANTQATRFTQAWTSFLAIRKSWAYRQDQLSSTHPVYSEVEDIVAAEVNFDGITYAKGASVIKQLVAYVGIDDFLAGLRQYFTSYSFGNASFTDLVATLSAVSGREFTGYASEWLTTAQVNTLRPVVDIAPDGTYRSVVVEQAAPPDHPTLRRHRVGVGLYDLSGTGLVRREIRYVDLAGATTELCELHGAKAADVLLINDEDHSYVKLRLDDRSMSTLLSHVGGLESSLARALCWAAVWDMVCDAEFPTRDFIALVTTGLPAESDINILTAALTQAHTAIATFADEAWQATGWGILASTARNAQQAAAQGSGFQLAWTRAFASSARTDEGLALLRGWLDGVDVPAGLSVTGDFRWHLIKVLAAEGGISVDRIEAEHARDRTAAGDREAATSIALLPTAEAKAAAWAELTSAEKTPNWRLRALLNGFHHPSQLALTEPYVDTFFDTAATMWAEQDNESARDFVVLGYPRFHISHTAVRQADAWLARQEHPAPLRRLVAEGRDTTARSLTARIRDAAAGMQ